MRLVVPPGYTAEELERDNPYNQWMREVDLQPSSNVYSVVERDGRFLVCRRVAALDNCHAVVDDCRTEKFAKERAAYLESGGK